MILCEKIHASVGMVLSSLNSISSVNFSPTHYNDFGEILMSRCLILVVRGRVGDSMAAEF